MKKIFLFMTAVFATVSLFAQPKLRPDNIDEIVKALTLGAFQIVRGDAVLEQRFLFLLMGKVGIGMLETLPRHLSAHLP